MLGGVNVVNVIEMETPGTIKIYKKDNQGKVVSKTVTVNSEEDKKKLITFIIAAATFSTGAEGKYYDGWGDGSSGLNSREAVMKHYWGNGVKDILKNTGYLNNIFYNYNSIGADIDEIAKSTHSNLSAEADKIKNTPSLILKETAPKVEYKNKKAYIGPLKATYSGGTPSIQVGGNEVKWVTKNENGTFDSEQESSKYESEQVFYAVVDENIAKSTNELEVKFKLQYKTYKTRILLARNPSAKGQNLMYHAGQEATKSLEDSWTIATPQKKKLTIHKVGKNNENLANVEFRIYKAATGQYLKLDGYEKIQSNDEIDLEKYTVSGVDKEDREKATSFITNSSGEIKISNLETYSNYLIMEMKNPNYGYKNMEINEEKTSIEGGTIEQKDLANRWIKVHLNDNTILTWSNKKEVGNISGYVWLENSSGKANEYDGLYKKNNLGDDNKLTDLYKMEEGKLVVNPQATVKVQVKLRDKQTGNIIKGLPDEFDTKTGKYTFTDVEIANLANCEVIFVYDGFKYTTVVEQLDKVNGSKVKETVSEREALNSKFATVKENSEVIPGDGTENSVEYDVKQHEEGKSKWQTSEVSKINFNTNITATTTNTEYDLDTKLHDMKKDPNKQIVEVIDNVNMGIVLREQPKISINNDIYSALVEFDGYKYNYKYNGRQNYYENKNDDSIGVKFEQENTKQRYTRTVYASDIQAAADPEQRKDIKVSITYKMQIANESRTLKVMPKQIINYFDARYTIQAVGLSLEGQIAKNELRFSTPENVEGTAYKSTVIDFNKMIEPIQRTISEGDVKTVENVQEIYITFNVERDAIIKLLDGASTYHNAVEILSYATYYGENTSKIEDKQFATDISEAGSLYAGIDKMSQPGNMELKLIDYIDAEGNKDGTQILDTTNYEDDTASAPSLILEAAESRKISGTVWEDSITNTTNNQKLGDGIYKDGEKAIQGVTVSLHKLKEDGSVGETVKYSNNEDAITETDENGNYTFGCDGKKNGKYVGVLPGKYVIKYTYNNEDYIVDIDENKNINVNDYKSTIIPEEAKHIKTAFGDTEKEPNKRWYLVQQDNRYSDARDDITKRPEYNTSIPEDTAVTNSTYNTVLKVEEMDAHTPKMDIGIEFTEEDEANAIDENGLSVDFEEELSNIDFGIVERPDVKITIEKDITGLEIIAQNGTVIIPKGDPSNPNAEMQYVKTGLDGVVPAEIDPQLLQGAQLNLEYTITVTNNCDRDYLELSYYYYGTGGKTESTTTVKKVVDYLKSTMILDMDKTQESGSNWTETTVDKLSADGYISGDVRDELEKGNYKVFTTDEFNGLSSGETEEAKLYTTKYLAISDIIIENNSVEIIELTGTRTAKESIPGNNVPDNPSPEPDGDEVKLIITPPTGLTVNYNIYIIAVVVTFTILIAGIVIIKKKIIK